MPTILYVMFALTFVPILMAVAGVVLRIKQFGHLDNHHPRLQQVQMVGMGARVNAAQANSWEALIVFSVVVFIAYVCGVPLESLDKVAISFLVLRLIYCGLYVANRAWSRSAVYAAGLACCMYIFYLAVMYGAKGA